MDVSDARLKAHTDLWIHCNTLMWSRLQPFYLIQGAFFATAWAAVSSATTLGASTSILYIWAALFVAGLFQLLLIVIVTEDRKYRDRQGKIIFQDFDIDILQYSLHNELKIFSVIMRDIVFLCIFGSGIIIDLLVTLHLSCKLGDCIFKL
jgi:hypothetical protein